jgi:glycosyltransferase involved in cell wall biosynthesis
VIRNLPLLEHWVIVEKKEKFILYQGAVNEGRGLEYLVPAMKSVPFKLVICGDGNFMSQLKELVLANDLGSKMELKGMLLPEQVKAITKQATLGIALSEREGINQYHALPNKFLDYIHAGLPQLTMNFPEYQRINNKFHVAELIDELSVEEVSLQINKLMSDDIRLKEMRENCLRAREIYCWQKEEVALIEFYKQVLPLG